MLNTGDLVFIKGDPVEILENLGKGYKLIKFTNTGNIIKAHITNISTGEVRDRLKRDVRGVGFFGIGEYNCKHKSHQYWSNMFERCYNKVFQERQPTYVECVVADEWQNFQTFAKWFDDNFPTSGGVKYELDKDILVKGNKTYGPDFCCFVPKRVNQYLVSAKASRGVYPLGVSPAKQKPGKFEVRCADLSGVRRFLGHVIDAIQGFYIYKEYKESKIKELAEECFKNNTISQKVYNALLNFKITIED